MIGTVKFVIVSLFATLFVIAQAYCACAIPFDASPTPPNMSNMDHHDHSEMMGTSEENQLPCAHCEQGMDKTTLSISSAVISAPVYTIQISNFFKTRHFTTTANISPNKALERHAWLDPPPSLIITPITLKTRLLT